MAEHPLSRRVKDQEPRVGIGDDHAVSHTIEYRLENSRLLAQRRLGASQFRGVLFLALVQAADLLELAQTRQGPRRVIGERFERAQVEPTGVDGRTRRHLKRAQHLGAHQRKHDLPANSR